MLLAFGLVSALLEAKKSGRGQVIDASMVDGVALLMAQMYSFHASGDWSDTREANVVDGGAPFYSVYECEDGRYVSVTAAEPSFYAALLKALELTDAALPPQWERTYWADTRAKFAAAFRKRTRDEWCRLCQGTRACITPVLSPREAPSHPHNASRNTFLTIDGVVQPAPAPRFSLTPGEIQGPPPGIGEHSAEVLQDWLAWDEERTRSARQLGAVFELAT